MDARQLARDQTERLHRARGLLREAYEALDDDWAHLLAKVVKELEP